jgi:DNA repair exonuclease SbcCD ATPase subunit
MADTTGPPREPGLEPRVARLETDVAEIKSTLNRLAPRIDEMYGSLLATLPNLVTKAELADLRAELKSDMAGLRTELKSDMAGLRTEVKSEIAGLRTEVKLEIAELRSELKSDTAELRSELKSDTAGLRTELKSEIVELRLGIMQRPTRRQTVFDIFAIVGLIGVVLTIASHVAH